VARTGKFRYQLAAGTDRAAAVTLFSEFFRHAGLHPFIVAVREETPAPAGCVRRFWIDDRIPVGPVHLPITYVADVVSVSDDRIATVARQRPATTLHIVTQLREVDDALRAEVEITMTAPSLLFNFGFRQAQRAHAELAPKLSELLTG